MAYLRSGIDGGRQGSSLIRNRVVDIRGDLATGGRLVLSTTEPTVVDGNELGRIDFQAPLDTAGTDAILVAASIYAEADATFSSSVNATELVFATGASEAAAEKMRLTHDGELGIGVATPASLLHVAGTVQVGVNDTGHDVKFFGATDGSYMLWDESIDDLILGGAARLGIGTTAPAVKFHIQGGGTALTHAGQTAQDVLIEGATSAISGSSPQLSIVSNSAVAADAGGVLGFGAKYATNNWKYLAMIKGAGTGGASPDGYLSFGVWKHSGSDFSEAMRIIGGGNVGIGVTAPASLLHVAGTVQVGVDDTGHDVKFFGAASGRYMMWDESSELLYVTDNAKIGFGNAGADMQMYHDGTDSYINNSTGVLKIATATSGIAVSIGHTTSVTTVNDDLTITGTAGFSGDILQTGASCVLLSAGGAAYINAGSGDLNQNGSLIIRDHVNAANDNRDFIQKEFLNIGGTGTGSITCFIQGQQGFGTAPNYSGGFNMKLYHPWAYGDKFRFYGDGNAHADVAFVDNGFDFAEMYEWEDGNSDDEYRAGYSVVMHSDGSGKIRKSTNSDSTDDIIGVVSEVSGFVGNAAWGTWAEKWQTDDFGKKITRKEEAWYWETVDEQGEMVVNQYGKLSVPDDVTVPADADTLGEEDADVLNPDYDASSAEDYETRKSRPEWTVVGLLGQVPTRKGQKLGTRWLKTKDISDTVELYLVR